MTEQQEEVPHGTNWIPGKPKRVRPKRDWSRTREVLQNFQTDPFWRLAILFAELLGVLAALWALFLSIDQSRLAQAGLQDQRLMSAMQILATPMGTTGKKYAVETLMAIEKSMVDIDLSCQALGRQKPDGSCPYPLRLDGITIGQNPWMDTVGQTGGDDFVLSTVNLTKASLAGATFRGTRFEGVDLSHTIATKALFYRVTLANSSLAGADLSRARFIRTRIESVDFTNTDLSKVEFDQVKFGRNNISGVQVCANLEVRNLDQSGIARNANTRERCNAYAQDLLADAWFWISNPPKGLGAVDPGTPIGGVCRSEAGVQSCSQSGITVRDVLEQTL